MTAENCLIGESKFSYKTILNTYLQSDALLNIGYSLWGVFSRISVKEEQ